MAFLRIIFVGFVDFLIEIAEGAISPFQNFYITSLEDSAPPTPPLSWLMVQYMAACLAARFFGSILVCALDVLVVRLATTRLGSASTPELSALESKPAVPPGLEPVTHLKKLDCTSPLHILMAAWRDEGLSVLFRGFWVTLLMSLSLGMFPVGLCFTVLIAYDIEMLCDHTP